MLTTDESSKNWSNRVLLAAHFTAALSTALFSLSTILRLSSEGERLHELAQPTAQRSEPNSNRANVTDYFRR